MVICPIARAVHCTGCIFFKFCPAKTILGDFKKDNPQSAKEAVEKESQTAEGKAHDSGNSSPDKFVP